MSALAWWSCPSGVSGDMILGALVAAGAPLEELQAAIDALPVEPVRLSARTVQRAGVAAVRVLVETSGQPARRDWAGIRDLLGAAALAGPVRELAGRVFERLARAEAAVHGIAPEAVHFHEVGALDSLADVVGAAAGLHALGVGESGCSRLVLGSGSVVAEHGALPVPAPAVLELMREAGAPVVVGGEGELATPTGAALLAATVTRWGDSPPLTVRSFGFGAGARDRADVPNVAGLVVGEAPDGAGDWVLAEANVDDLDPRLWPAVLSALLEAGAADAWLTPIVMKKGRPAHTVHALAEAALLGHVREVLYRETSTIGVRCQRVGKDALAREFASVSVWGEPVRVKLARLGGAVVSATPEFADVSAAAARLGRSAREVLAAANAAAARAGYLPSGEP